MPPNGYGMGGFGGMGNFGPGWGTAPWWGAPAGWSDIQLYDYNNNYVLDDDEIRDLVMDNILADPGIPMSDAHNIMVNVKDSVATLSGTVHTPRSKPLAYTDAFWSSGVRDVENNIEVQTPERKNEMNQGQMPRRGM